jgi:hypothetical protein
VLLGLLFGDDKGSQAAKGGLVKMVRQFVAPGVVRQAAQQLRRRIVLVIAGDGGDPSLGDNYRRRRDRGSLGSFRGVVKAGRRRSGGAC